MLFENHKSDTIRVDHIKNTPNTIVDLSRIEKKIYKKNTILQHYTVSDNIYAVKISFLYQLCLTFSHKLPHLTSL